MEFEFSSEQKMLRDTAWGWARSVRDSGVSRSRVSGAAVDVDGLWRQIAEYGWPAIAIPEEDGGAGGSIVDACLVLEALSQELIPVPFANAITMSTLLRESRESADGLLGRIATGEIRVAPVLTPSLEWPASPGPALAWDWSPGDAVIAIVGGQPQPVHDITVAEYASVDPMRSLGELVLPDTFAPGPESDAVRRSLAVARVAASAALVGTMSGALDLALGHVSARHQFGQPIGSFQSVQHMCADMLVDLESSRSITYGAAWTVENGDLDSAEAAAAAAKAWCAPAARRVCEAAVQALGGMAITWESDAHVYLRAAHLWGAAFGNDEESLSTVAEPLFTATAPDSGGASR